MLSSLISHHILLMFMNPIPIQLSLFSVSENKLESIYLSICVSI